MKFIFLEKDGFTMQESLICSGFIYVIEKEWFSHVMSKLDMYSCTIISKIPKRTQMFMDKSVVVISAFNMTPEGFNTLGSLEKSSEEDFLEDDELLELRDKAFMQFEEELFKNPEKILCETFDA